MARRVLQVVTGILAGMAIVAVIVLLTPPPSGPVEWDGASAPPEPYPAPPLELVDLDGNTVNLASFRGRTTVVFFGYSNCPDVCPATLLNLSGVLDGLSAREADRIRVVFVTLDPERDTPERLRSWLANFHPSIQPLTGEQENIWLQAYRWGVHASISARTATDDDDAHAHHHDPGASGLPDGLDRVVTAGAPGAYSVEHSTRSFVLDRQGRIVLFLAPFQGAESMATDLRRVMR
jgi:protein SCO1/2